MENKPELIRGKYYWVKCFSESKYEPARCSDRYRNDNLHFCFTNGSIKECDKVKDYKELVNPFNT